MGSLSLPALILAMDKDEKKDIKRRLSKDVIIPSRGEKSSRSKSLQEKVAEVTADPEQQRQLTKLIRKKLERIMLENPEVKELWRERLHEEAQKIAPPEDLAETKSSNSDTASIAPQPPTRRRSRRSIQNERKKAMTDEERYEQFKLKNRESLQSISAFKD